MGVDEEGTLERLKALRRELVEPKIAEHHGRIVKTTGDGMLVEFGSVVDAVRRAVAVQQAIPERNTGVAADNRIELSIGINLGDVMRPRLLVACCHRSSIGKGKQVVRSPKGEPDYQPSKASGELSALDYKKYLNLETYRRNGAGVRTPVWFAAGPKDYSRAGFPKFYVYTIADSGKAKRIRRSGVVRIAPCDMRGKVTGSWTNALAEVVTGEEFELGMRLLDRKYFPWKQILNLSAMLFRRRERVVLAIRPVPTDASSGDSAVGQ